MSLSSDVAQHSSLWLLLKGDIKIATVTTSEKVASVAAYDPTRPAHKREAQPADDGLSPVELLLLAAGTLPGKFVSPYYTLL